jgi:Hemerythrin HHE cation binding domain
MHQEIDRGRGELDQQSLDPTLDAVVGQRRSLRRALSDVESTLASPAAGRTAAWMARLTEAMENLRDIFDLHVEVTEGHGGLFEDILATAPRLANRVRRLRAEHAAMRMMLNSELLRLRGGTVTSTPSEVDDFRSRVNDLLALLVRHRQQGADLLYEAYHFDIGGEGS